ncbi:BRCT domain-containing protein [Alishewanella sp. d11]|uniref:BRCT domain-containing protein n=1 Tax=Alishewanella sp. d11 TaxID=3414030 RepID=UPI003BF82B5F
MLFNSKSRLDKSINNFIGIIEGIAVDGKITAPEVYFLNAWLDENRLVLDKHPFNELAPVVQEAIADGIITDDERADILWLCEKLTSNEYYCQITSTMQRLHGILAGIAADGKITELELTGLRTWLDKHQNLKTIWPYDEVDSLITNVMADGVIDAEEHKLLLNFFMEFTSLADDVTLTSPQMDGENLFGICATCPEIEFDGKTFCFTGESQRFKRKQLAQQIEDRGGIFIDTVSKKVQYLVVGANGNPNWAYACYGRKIEQAIVLRRKGFPLVIVHENDYHDAIQG